MKVKKVKVKIQSKGKHEDDWYIVGGSEMKGGGTDYHIMWLDNGTRLAGFDTAEAARANADRIVDNYIARGKK